jgi:predicted Zn-dependent protease
VCWRYNEVRFTQGTFRGEQIRLERGGDSSEALVISDETFLDAFRRAMPPYHGRSRKPGRRRNWAMLGLIAGLGAVAAGATLYIYGIPLLADVAASRLPLSWEERLGQAVLDGMAPRASRCTDPARVAIIENLVRQLAAAAPPSRYTFRVHVTANPLPNAFAAPGGFIVVYEGLLDLTETPEELAGVLAHEMSHVVARHSTRALFRELSLAALIAAASGDVRGLDRTVAMAAQLGGLRYRRSDEEMADREGTRMLIAAHVDPAGLVRFLGRLEEEVPGLPRGLDYLSTHPATAERIATLTRLAAAAPVQPRPVLPGYQWSRMKGICVPD